MSKDGLVGKKVNVTKDYRLFGRSDENRCVSLKKHRALERSMKQYGFLACYPIICFRRADGSLIVKDGQHRLAFAESLGLSVFWVEVDVDFDVATVNSTAKVWVCRDYAEKHAANGLAAYREGLDFADKHKLSIGSAFSLLAGTTTFGNIEEQFKQGLFKIKDRAWADSVASVYVPICGMSSDVRNARFLEACMAACRVDGFDIDRMISNASKCRDKLASYSTREAYLGMIEEIYNFGRQKLMGIKAAATMAMRERNATVASKAKKNAKAAQKAEEVAA